MMNRGRVIRGRVDYRVDYRILGEFFHFKFKKISYLFTLKNSRPCLDLNPGLPWYQANMLPIELSWLFIKHFDIKENSYTVGI